MVSSKSNDTGLKPKWNDTEELELSPSNNALSQDTNTGEWYFWDESWYKVHGPYANEELAKKSLMQYESNIDGVRDAYLC
jgi:hypothetical protein